MQLKLMDKVERYAIIITMKNTNEIKIKCFCYETVYLVDNI